MPRLRIDLLGNLGKPGTEEFTPKMRSYGPGVIGRRGAVGLKTRSLARPAHGRARVGRSLAYPVASQVRRTAAGS